MGAGSGFGDISTGSGSGPGLFLFFVVLLLLALRISSALGDENPVRQPFTIDDYFKIKRITELSLSSDGQLTAYVVESQSLEENKSLRQVYINPTTPEAKLALVEEIQDARNIAWIPGKHELAFLSSRDGVSQIFSYNHHSKTIRQYTDGESRVTQFAFAADGKSLAYITQDISSIGMSLYDQFQTGGKGILINSDTINIYDFIDPDWPDLNVRNSEALWLALTDKTPFQTDIPGNVKSFYWSPDTKRLSVTYVADDVPPTLGSDRWTSLGIYNVNRMRFRLLAAREPPSESYTGGEWVPGENKIIILRISERDLWMKQSTWTLFDLSAVKKFEAGKNAWHEIEYSGRDRFILMDRLRIYVNKTVKAVRSLYQITPSGMKRAGIARNLNGSTSLFQFSDDFELAAFVSESLTRPPEIFIWRRRKSSQQLTRLNEALSKRILPAATEVIWKSSDGIPIHGWLLEPVGAERDNKPWPLITFVHGGPGYAMPNEFASYFRFWPFPFESYALNGMAVFIPNYRGTLTYGRKFADPSKIDGEPVDDIVSGVNYLVQKGIADPKQLAISGHSHGAWLASLVMTRAKLFRAGSFAEGTSNMITNYDLMPGILNREVHDVVNGESPYDDPARYIALSPELHFKGLDAAVLFEAGVRASAISMLGFPKAAQNADMPTEYIIYPKIGHNITIPRLQKESAERNLDWFRFWLKGEVDPNPAKDDQYQHWREMIKQ